jgi:phosphatidylglycerophosphate synthase
LRFALAGPFVVACVWAIDARTPAGRWLPLVLFGLAAGSDYLDGRLARRGRSTSPRGQILDNAADILFIGSGLVWFASRGRISWMVPVAVAAAVGTYVRDSWRPADTTAVDGLARSRIGHAAGVANYTLVGLLAGVLAAPTLVAPWMIDVGAAITIGINGVSAASRVLLSRAVRRRRVSCDRARSRGAGAPPIPERLGSGAAPH